MSSITNNPKINYTVTEKIYSRGRVVYHKTIYAKIQQANGEVLKMPLSIQLATKEEYDQYQDQIQAKK